MSQSQSKENQNQEKQASRAKGLVIFGRLAKVTVFISIAAAFFVFLNSFFFPFRKDWSNYDTLNGFYTQPENSIEVLFMGTSMVLCGINPMEMYENYGISAYNVGSEQQSVLASYYWAKEIYKYNKDSLKTVVLDASGLRSSRSEKFFHKTMEPMKLDEVKVEAARKVAVDFKDFLSYTLPIYSYHDRWASIDNTDYIKYSTTPLSFKRGYCYYNRRAINSRSLADLSIFASRITTDYFDPTGMNGEEMDAFYALKEWCDQEGLNLVLMKLPQRSWGVGDRNFVANLSKEINVPYVDLKYGDLMDASSDLNMGLHTVDRQHYNIEGANLVSNCLAKYLLDNGYANDIRDTVGYEFMEDYLADFKEYTLRSRLGRIVNPVEYLKEVMPGHMVFISVRDDAQKNIGESNLEGFRELGLKELPNIKYRDSYVAVIDNGRVVAERRASDKPERDEEDDDISSEEEEIVTSVSYSGETPDGKAYVLKSAGYKSGDFSSCIIGAREESKNSRGLNIVVYNPRIHEMVDSVVFDTFTSPNRYMEDVQYGMEMELASGKKPANLSDPYRKCYLYLTKCENLRDVQYIEGNVDSQTGLLDYLKVFANKDHISIYLTANGDAASALTPSVRASLKNEFGLEKFSELDSGSSYIGVYQGGSVIYEDSKKKGGKIQYKASGLSITSTSTPGKEKASCIISGKEKSPDQPGINIVVYDDELATVVDEAVFNTGEIPQDEL